MPSQPEVALQLVHDMEAAGVSTYNKTYTCMVPRFGDINLQIQRPKTTSGLGIPLKNAFPTTYARRRLVDSLVAS